MRGRGAVRGLLQPVGRRYPPAQPAGVGGEAFDERRTEVLRRGQPMAKLD